MQRSSPIFIRFKRFALALTGAALAVSLPFDAAARLYKWVDDQGKVHYGDKVPPEYAKKERKVLNQQGVEVDKLDAAKTPEEIAEQKRLEEKRREEERKRAERAAHDRMLLATFTTVDDMIMTRDGKIAAIDSVIRVTRGRIEKLEAKVEEHTRRAANLERSGRAVPESLQQRIAATRKQIREYRNYIESKQAEQEAIREQFEADIRRFRELKQMQEEQRQQAEQSQ